MKALSIVASAVIGGLLVGCGTTAPPVELKTARTAYQSAVQSPGATLAQTDIYEAKQSLQRAENAFSANGDAQETRDLAYVAERKARIAQSRANTAVLLQAKTTAMNEANQLKQQAAGEGQLGQTKSELARTQRELDSERQARMAAEQRTADAMAKIRGLSAKQDQRGLVVSLTGDVLFAFGKSDLLPTAKARLDDVIVALKDDPRPISIVGHTDSVGSDEANQRLSEKRADSVRRYFCAHGLPQDRVTSMGMGKAEPITSNKTPEGRANNRRVEIILKGPMEPAKGTPMPKSGQSGAPEETNKP